VSNNLGVVVEATDPDGDIVEVFLYIDNKLVRREGGAPYEWGLANSNQEDPLLLNLTPGNHVLRAEANDNEGAQGTATLSVTVSGDTNPDDNFVDGPGKIVYPWRATTAVLKGGESFNVMFIAEPDQTVDSVILKGPYNKLYPSIDVDTGSWVYDKTSGNKYNTKITVHVPSGSPADRYDLILRTSIGDEVSLGSVKVVKKYQSNYYIMHFSDTKLHVDAGRFLDMDIIYLKDGGLIKGWIVNERNNEILIETGKGTFTLPRSICKSIEKDVFLRFVRKVI